MNVYPIALTSQVKKLIGVPVGTAPKKKKVQKKVSYRQNLFTALKTDIKNPSEDQILGLEFALGQLKEADAYKNMKRDLEYSAKQYGCSFHELHDPKLEYPEEIEW